MANRVLKKIRKGKKIKLDDWSKDLTENILDPIGSSKKRKKELKKIRKMTKALRKGIKLLAKD